MRVTSTHVAIRADAARDLGTGHVMRCLNLADGLASRGVAVTFICSPQPGHLGEVIEHRGHGLRWLPPQANPAKRVYTDALPLDCQEDAAATLAAIGEIGSRPSWIVVDHYSFDYQWERALRAGAERIMVIDDLTSRRHDCDLLLNQNMVVPADRHLLGETGDARVLLGPQFALMSPRYALLRDRIPPRQGPVRRLLVFLGDAGPVNVTGRVLDGILALGRQDILVDLVIAMRSPHAAQIREAASAHRFITVHQSTPDLAEQIAAADLAIGGAGATSWERLCLGLPALVIDLAENQRAIARALEAANFATWIGSADTVTVDSIAGALDSVLAKGIDIDWSRRCSAAVDGRGVERVCGALLPPPATPLSVRYQANCDVAATAAWTHEQEAGEVERERRSLVTSRFMVVETLTGDAVAAARFRKIENQWSFACRPLTSADAASSMRRYAGAALHFLRREEAGSLRISRSRDRRSPALTIAVCTDKASWINTAAAELIATWAGEGHELAWVHDADDLVAGDVAIFLGYGRIVSPEVLKRHTRNLVVHESDLPHGRGWSPLTWQILEGRDAVVVSLIEAAQDVDSGPIYAQESLRFDGTELIDELRAAQAAATVRLCEEFVRDYPESATRARPQTGTPTYYPRRRPIDSQLDPNRTLRDQFNLFRVADNDRYPAWVEIAGRRYELRIKRA